MACARHTDDDFLGSTNQKLTGICSQFVTQAMVEF